jgi:hypothetical protein
MAVDCLSRLSGCRPIWPMPFLLSLFEKGPCRQVAATTEFLIPLGPVMRVRRHDRRVQSRRILISVLEANSATATWWS